MTKIKLPFDDDGDVKGGSASSGASTSTGTSAAAASLHALAAAPATHPAATTASAPAAHSAATAASAAAPSPAPASATMLTGFFEGATPSDLTAAQHWLGSSVGAVTVFTGQASWSDYTGSVGYEQGLWSGYGKTDLWSIPLFANGGDLHDAGTGAYDSYYKQVAQQLVSGQSTGSIYVRTGWEFNGNWEIWSAQSNPSDYIAAFQDFVNAFRSVSNRFVFTWAPNIGNQGMNPAAAYPGDKYVDIIGMDTYQQGASESFSTTETEQYGLNWLTSFAAAHGKPVAIPEWGVDSDTSGAYVQQAAAWMKANHVVYESYWDSDSGYEGKLSDGQYADTGSAFIKAFGPPAAPVVTTLSHASSASASTAVGTGMLELAALHAAGTGAVGFDDGGAGAILKIDNAALTGSGHAAESFSNVIKGMAGSDLIDLSGLGYQASSPSSFAVGAHGALLVHEGAVTVALTTDLAAGTELYAFQDSHGGTYLSLSAGAGQDATHYHP